MLEDKRVDLEAEKQRQLIQRLVQELSRSHVDFYYRSTSEIAMLIANYAKSDAKLTQEDVALLEGLSRREIEFLLSTH